MSEQREKRTGIRSTEQMRNLQTADGKEVESPVEQVLHQLLQIPVGVLLCGKYTVEAPMRSRSVTTAVYLCTYQGEQYVAKVFLSKSEAEKTELTALKGIDSSFVAKVYDTGEYNGFPFIIVPYYPHGSLQNKTYSFEELRRKIIPGLNEGLRALHQAEVFHKALKPSNIMLLDRGGDIVITDYGTGVDASCMSILRFSGTENSTVYAAPETFRGIFLKESDYYSLGVTIFELFSGKTLYEGLSPKEYEYCVCSHHIPFPANMPEELCTLITGLTYPDISNHTDRSHPDRRWTYEEVKSWCEGGTPGIPGLANDVIQDIIPAYTFQKRKYTDVKSLAIALAEEWEAGKLELFRGLLSGFFKPVNPEIAGYCLDAERTKGDPDVLFFRTLCKICPTRALYWKNYRFNSLHDLGCRMLDCLRARDTKDSSLYDELLSLGVISTYCAAKDQNNTELIQAVLSIEKHYAADRRDKRKQEYDFYRLAYLLSGQRSLLLQGQEYHTVDELVQELKQRLSISEAAFEKLCGQLIDDSGKLAVQFEVWMLMIGKQDELLQWRRNEYGAP